MTGTPTHIARYQILDRIGQGGMGVLYRAWDPKLDRQIAIKLLLDDEEELRERFAREARSAARLRHPHIVMIYDVGEHDGMPFIAMEYIQGQTLAEMIAKKVPLPVVRRLELVEQLCEGLGFAHKTGIIHRDVKPANAMVDNDGELKILDFGIARIAEASSMTRAGMVLGTLNYMSPEQIAGGNVDARSDIFAVGAVMYELLAYRQAFPGGLQTGLLNRIMQGTVEPLQTLAPSLDGEIVAIVSRALEVDRDKRYQDLTAMRRDIQRVRMRLDTGDMPTIVMEAPAEPSAPPPSQASSSRRHAAKEELAKRRAAQIREHLDAANQAFAANDYATTIARCEQVLLLDVDEEKAIDLMDRARRALDMQEAGRLLDAAGEALGRGAVTEAAQLVDNAGTLDSASPRLAKLRSQISSTRQTRDAAEQRDAAIRSALEQARASLEQNRWDEAIAAADAALAVDASHAEALTLKARAQSAIDAQARAAADRRAADAVAAADRLAADGRDEEAIDLLASFEPRHDAVSRALQQRRAAKTAREEQRQREASARERRIREGIAAARAQIDRKQFGPALERLQALARAEGDSPELAAALAQAEAGKASADRTAASISAALGAARQAFDAHDYPTVLARLDEVKALDSGNADAKQLRARVDNAVREQEKQRKRAEQERAARERADRERADRERAERERAAADAAAAAPIAEAPTLYIPVPPKPEPPAPAPKRAEPARIAPPSPPLSTPQAPPAEPPAEPAKRTSPVVYAGAAAAVAVIAIGAYALRGGKGPDAGGPPGPGAQSVLTTTAPPVPPRRIGTDVVGTAPPPPTAPAPGNPGPGEGELAQLRATARQQLTRGAQEEALATVEKGLAMRGDDPELRRTLSDLLTDARARVSGARTGARGARPGPDLSDAQRAEREATRFERAGRSEQAIRQLWAAAASYQKAGMAVAKVNPATPSPGQLPTNPGRGTPEQPPRPTVVTSVATTVPVTSVPVQPTTVAPVTSVDPRAADDAAIRNVIARYQQAYAALDADAVGRVYPKVNVSGLRRAFAETRSIEVEIAINRINSDGREATVTGTRTTVSQGKVGKEQRDQRGVTVKLQKSGGNWVITDLR